MEAVNETSAVRLELDPDVANGAPTGDDITPYDEQHFETHLRLPDWIVLYRDPATDTDRIRRCWESYLARAHWMTKRGYRWMLEQAVEQGHTSYH